METGVGLLSVDGSIMPQKVQEILCTSKKYSIIRTWIALTSRILDLSWHLLFSGCFTARLASKNAAAPVSCYKKLSI